MRFKVASRVRCEGGYDNAVQGCIPGAVLGAAAFREAFGTEEQCRSATASSVRAVAIAGIAFRHSGPCISATAAGSGPRSPQARSSM